MWKLVHRHASVLLGLTLTLTVAASGASAATLTTFLAEFTGDPIVLEVVLDDGVGPNQVEVSVDVVGEVLGDIRGVFMNIDDDALLAGLLVSGPDVTDWDFGGSVINLGNGANLISSASPCPCDLGVEIGTPGLGSDDVQSTTFTLTHASQTLTVADFADQFIGVRVTSVGPEGDREGSSKTVALVPEPSTGCLMLAGLAGLAIVSSNRRRRPRKPRRR
jgi:hypothetical protein